MSAGPNVVDMNSFFCNQMTDHSQRAMAHIEQDNRALGGLLAATLLASNMMGTNASFQIPNPNVQIPKAGTT